MATVVRSVGNDKDLEMNRELASWIVAAIRPPLMLIRFITTPIFSLCFGALEKVPPEKMRLTLLQILSVHLDFCLKNTGLG